MRNSHSIMVRSIAVAFILVVAVASFVASAFGATDVNLMIP